MNSLAESPLAGNIARYNLDSKLGMLSLNIEGTGLRIGERPSKKEGQSTVVLDYRHYRAGDSIKDIDWKLSARTEKLYLKVREGLKQAEFDVVLDASQSMRSIYSKNTCSKFTLALTITYILGRIALKSRDHFNIISGETRYNIDGINSLLPKLIDIEQTQKSDSASFLSTNFKKRGTLFVLSDFFEDTLKIDEYLKAARLYYKRIFLVITEDQNEKQLSFDGNIRFIDEESSDYRILESNNIRKKYIRAYLTHYKEVTEISNKYGIKIINMSNAEDPFKNILRMLSV